MGDGANTAARAEYQRKQRDRKRLYRARLKNDMESMRAQVQMLEAKYEELYAARVAKHAEQQQQQQVQPATALQLQDRYAAARQEILELRSQIEATKQKLGEYDLLEASLECYLTEFQRPASPVQQPLGSIAPESNHSPSIPNNSRASPPSSPFPQLTEQACQEIIKQCYQEIINRKWSGRMVSSGNEMLGWADQRYVDGEMLHFSLSKSFPNLGKEDLMMKTWDILTTTRHTTTLQSSTLSVKILQRISDDIVVLQRRVYHAQLQTVMVGTLIEFRIRTETGYIVAYRTLNHPGFPRDADSELLSVDDSDVSDKNKRDEIKKSKLKWVDTMQWFRFDDFQDGTSGCHVLIGGRTQNRDATYANFFLFEVVTYIIRWESAVSCSRLLLPDTSNDDDP
uniref:BZIP domain-containing protein n=1 Tax=Globisporangium ultimum (strain ATCC 200006 / CBS 805.95 / DAOM BR144) TaxID=431595 RepID=K3X4J1_GLOUD